MKIEYIDFDKRSPDIVYKGLCKSVDIDLVTAPSSEAAVLVVPLVGQESVDFLEKTELPQDCFIIFMVFEFTGAIAPFLKLADYIFYLGPKQKEIVEGLLDGSYRSEQCYFPGDKEVLPLERHSSFIYLPNKFSADFIPFIEECISLGLAWYEPESTDGEINVLCTVEEDQRKAFEAFQKEVCARKECTQLQLHIESDLMTEEIVDLIKVSHKGDCFTQEESLEQVADLIAQKHPSLLYAPRSSNWIIEEMVRYNLRCVHDYQGVLRSLIMDKHTSISMEDFFRKFTNVLEKVLPAVEKERAEKRAQTDIDTLGTLNILHGEPLKNRFIFSICFRNQEDKIVRALDSILAQEGDFDFGIAIVDDGSEDRSADIILERLLPADVDFMLVKNKKRRYAARNFYNVAHLMTVANEESILIELDGDDFLSGTKVLKRLDQEYRKGYLKTCGSFSIYPEIKEGDAASQELFDKQISIDFSRPWNLTTCTSWLPLRSCNLNLLRNVEIDYFLERESSEWLKERHDAITQSRIIELAGADKCSFIKDELYVYDLSGQDHDHGSTEEFDYNKAHLKLFTDLNMYYRAYSIY